MALALDTDLLPSLASRQPVRGQPGRPGCTAHRVASRARRQVRQLPLGRRRTSRLELELHLVDVEVVEPLDVTALIELEGVQQPVDVEEEVGSPAKGVGALRSAVPKWSRLESPPGSGRLHGAPVCRVLAGEVLDLLTGPRRGVCSQGRSRCDPEGRQWPGHRDGSEAPRMAPARATRGRAPPGSEGHPARGGGVPDRAGSTPAGGAGGASVGLGDSGTETPQPGGSPLLIGL